MPLKGEEGCSLAPLGKKQAFGKKVLCNGLCQARDVQHQASSSLCKEGEATVKSRELLGVEKEPQKHKNNAGRGCCSRASLLIDLEGKDQPVRTRISKQAGAQIPAA